jgi:2-polyprenyl-3-methyl-5-hydroxy-6-metoxy-1,4-benzoquinol methylase
MEQLCVVCASAMKDGLAPWHFICVSCGYEGTTLKPRINEPAAYAVLKEADREAGLKNMRVENFRVIVRAIRRLAQPGQKTLLDVGSAHGWFLQEAASLFTVTGIEPDQEVAARSRQGGHLVRTGFFPSVLIEHERFDVIVLNDVIEHIPAVNAAVAACIAHLNDDGLLVLNLPSSAGFFYRLSKILARVGWRQPFERMWQKDLPSPHVHYFSPLNLIRLAQDQRLKLLTTFELPSIQAQGLLERMRWAGDLRGMRLWAQYLCVLCVLPVIHWFKSDIQVAIFRVTNHRPAISDLQVGCKNL